MACFTLLRKRRERGWTQAELAQKAGVATVTVLRLERSKLPTRATAGPTAATLKAIADVFGERVDAVFPEMLASQPQEQAS